jgi:hypothetical protein
MDVKKVLTATSKVIIIGGKDLAKTKKNISWL